MKMIVVLFAVFCWCFCEAKDPGTNEKVDSCSGMFNCDSLNLVQNFGAMEEKLTNMAEKIAVLEDALQNTQKTVLELRSITGGKSKLMYAEYSSFDVIYDCGSSWPLGGPQVAFSATLRDSGSGNIGPFSTDIPLQYKKVFSNAGDCYNPSTGSVCFREKFIHGKIRREPTMTNCSYFDRHFHSNGERNVLLSVLDVQQPKSRCQFSRKPEEEQRTSDVCLGHHRV